MKLHALVVVIAAGTACGGGNSTPAADAPPNVAATINASGTTKEITASGRTPKAGVTVASFKEGATAATSMTTSDASGNFTLAIPTMNMPVDGYLLAQISGFKDSYIYPAAPLVADKSGIPVLVLTAQTFDAAFAFAQVSRTPGSGFVGVQVIDASGASVAGATVTSTPAGTVRYNMGGLPNKNATVTDTDGIAFVLNVTAGSVMVSANKAGATFHTHAVNARADQVTQTQIAP